MCVEIVFIFFRVVGLFGNDVFWIIVCIKEICEECLLVNKFDLVLSYLIFFNIKWFIECEYGF